MVRPLISCCCAEYLLGASHAAQTILIAVVEPDGPVIEFGVMMVAVMLPVVFVQFVAFVGESERSSRFVAAGSIKRLTMPARRSIRGAACATWKPLALVT